MTVDGPINKIIRSKRRTLELQIAPDATLIVRAPFKTPLEEIQKIVRGKLPWITEKQRQMKEKYRPPVKKEFTDGEEFLYLGERYKLSIVEKLHVPLEFNGKEFLLWRVYRSVARNRFLEWYKQKAMDVISRRVRYYADSADLRFNRIMITDANSRWGSCGSKDTLSFSWRLIMAPIGVIDYVVIHELTHLTERNHSKRFWRKVEALFPDYKQVHRWLRTNHHLLAF